MSPCLPCKIWNHSVNIYMFVSKPRTVPRCIREMRFRKQKLNAATHRLTDDVHTDLCRKAAATILETQENDWAWLFSRLFRPSV
jgi:hypothetical protein